MHLVCSPSGVGDVQACFHILRIPTARRLNELLRIVPSHIVRPAAEEFDALPEWTFASTIAGADAMPEDLTLPSKVQDTLAPDRRLVFSPPIT